MQASYLDYESGEEKRQHYQAFNVDQDMMNYDAN